MKLNGIMTIGVLAFHFLILDFICQINSVSDFISNGLINETYIHENSYLKFQNFPNVQNPVIVLFRTCTPGILINHIFESFSVKLSITNSGNAQLFLKSSAWKIMLTLGKNLSDNLWHAFTFYFNNLSPYIMLDETLVVIPKMKTPFYLIKNDTLSDAANNFKGCIIFIDSLATTGIKTNFLGMEWNSCNLFIDEKCGNQCLFDNMWCFNGGTCIVNDHTNASYCICPKYFFGTRCEISVENWCNSDSCKNDNTCSNFHSCLCNSESEQLICDINKGKCDKNPCLNGGICIDNTDNNNYYICNCNNTGYSGYNCELDIDECSSVHICKNGGTCHNIPGDFYCQCPFGYTGKTCSEITISCSSNSCLNNGICYVDSSKKKKCLCPVGFSGPNCEFLINCNEISCDNLNVCSGTENWYYCNCNSNLESCITGWRWCNESFCNNKGICQLIEEEKSCLCMSGFEGNHCEVPVTTCNNGVCPRKQRMDNCDETLCQNNGSCLSTSSGHICNCASGFTGAYCEKDIDECVMFQPCINGICQNLPGSYQCYCRPGFSGDHCNIDFDECLSYPCFNNATCNNLVNNYSCACTPGFTGRNCETDINECESNPCQNEATCKDLIASFQCLCKPGFTGIQCEIDVDECESSPCQNGGNCQDGINNYTCECAGSGFEGKHCEFNIDDCLSFPCIHNSTCIDLVNDFKCSCHEGYSGKTCNVDIMECSSSPCENHGVCLEYSNQSLYEINYLGLFPSFNYATAVGYLCICPEGFTGNNCETDIDECESSPCIHGSCNDGINSYNCDCFIGYEGKICEVEIDECERYNPCHHGICQDLVSDYHCSCHEGWGGKNCSVILKGCENIYCENGGSCLPYVIDEIKHNYECRCLPGFSGQLCEEDTTLSFTSQSYLKIDHKLSDYYTLALQFITTIPNNHLLTIYGDSIIDLNICDKHLCIKNNAISKSDNFVHIFENENITDGTWIHMNISIIKSLIKIKLLKENMNVSIWLNPFPNNGLIYSTHIGLSMYKNLSLLYDNFIGCMRDIVLNDLHITVNRSSAHFFNLTVGCSRKEQCTHSPCLNGLCLDLWDHFQCSCHRPYIGTTCNTSYIPFTFGFESTAFSLIEVQFTPLLMDRLSNFFEISLFIRTRQENGFIYYLGSKPNSSSENFITFIMLTISSGKPVLELNLMEKTVIYFSENISISDGFYHFIEAGFYQNILTLAINGTLYKKKMLETSEQFKAEFLSLGEFPTVTSRLPRHNSDFVPFKGSLLDLQIKDRNRSYALEIFPVQNNTLDELFIITTQLRITKGSPSDDTCKSHPCLNNGTCIVTWNDYKCECPLGFKGKQCEELQLCTLINCPNHSICVDHKDGYNCIAESTFNGYDSSLMYHLVNEISSTFPNNSIDIQFRTQLGGIILFTMYRDNSLLISIENNSVNIFWSSLDDVQSLSFGNNAMDGQWHQFGLLFTEYNLLYYYDSIQWPQFKNLNFPIMFNNLFENGIIVLGSGPNNLDEFFKTKYHIDITFSKETYFHNDLLYYKGCIREVRIGGLLLPFFEHHLLIKNPAKVYYELLTDTKSIDLSCILCYDKQCQDGSICNDSLLSYNCNCHQGFKGQFCEINIDDCIESVCQHGSCIDGIANYTCACEKGYTSWLCDTEVNECEEFPCLNGGSCIDLIASYQCVCPEDYKGINCELHTTCIDSPCQNGATCKDSVDLLKKPINFICSCPYGYEGRHCEHEIDFCETSPCLNDATCTSVTSSGFKCSCSAGYSGIHCEIDIDDCQSHSCQNNALCIDQINSYSCNCSKGFHGTYCENDIDECLLNICSSNATCENLLGDFNCICPPGLCGKQCTLIDPCFQTEICLNGASCQPICTDESSETYIECLCPPQYTGKLCESAAFIDKMEIGVIIGPLLGVIFLISLVGLLIFIMMARKKRATRGTYSPSRQEMYGSRVEMGNIIKPPPEERLI